MGCGRLVVLWLLRGVRLLVRTARALLIHRILLFVLFVLLRSSYGIVDKFARLSLRHFLLLCRRVMLAAGMHSCWVRRRLLQASLGLRAAVNSVPRSYSFESVRTRPHVMVLLIIELCVLQLCILV